MNLDYHQKWCMNCVWFFGEYKFRMPFLCHDCLETDIDSRPNFKRPPIPLEELKDG